MANLLGTQLSVLLVHMHPRLGCCRMTLEGIFVCANPKLAKRHDAPSSSSNSR